MIGDGLGQELRELLAASLHRELDDDVLGAEDLLLPPALLRHRPHVEHVAGGLLRGDDEALAPLRHQGAEDGVRLHHPAPHGTGEDGDDVLRLRGGRPAEGCGRGECREGRTSNGACELHGVLLVCRRCLRRMIVLQRVETGAASDRIRAGGSAKQPAIADVNTSPGREGKPPRCATGRRRCGNPGRPLVRWSPPAPHRHRIFHLQACGPSA